MGFMQSFIVLAVEIVNIEIILTSLDPVDLVYNFIALAIIAEFDEFVYAALRNEPMKLLTKNEITQKILIIRHTTSSRCGEHELALKLEQEQDLRLLRVTFQSRNFGNKCMFVLYKCMRIFYVSVYFYFLPFTTIMLSCLIPIVYSFN